MKSNCAVNLSLWTVLGALLLCVSLRAQEPQAVERVMMNNGAMLIVQGGVSLPLTNEVSLPHGIKVMTNGTFRVHNGKARPLVEGQVLGADGMLTSPDGTLRPVFDHIAFLKGQALLIKDGEPSALSADVELPDGRHITGDGYLLSKSGLRRKL